MLRLVKFAVASVAMTAVVEAKAPAGGMPDMDKMKDMMGGMDMEKMMGDMKNNPEMQKMMNDPEVGRVVLGRLVLVDVGGHGRRRWVASGRGR